MIVLTEFEAKILDVDPPAVTESILARGGELLRPSTVQRRYVYDLAPGDASKWIRLRDNGHGVTLTIKEIRHDGIDGTDETEVGVTDFDATNELLNKLGYTARSYQENRRTSFRLGAAELELDEWPGIAPYLEIEADSTAAVIAAALTLGYQESDLTSENTVQVYARYGLDLLAVPYLRF